MMKRTLSVACIVAAVAFGSVAFAGSQYKQKLDLPAQFVASVQATACTTAPGPQVTIGGELNMSGLDVDMEFSNPQGEPGGPVTVARAVVPPDQPMTVTQQSVTGAVPNNPYIWLQLTDSKGKALTSEIFLGRCDEGQLSANIDFLIPGEALADVTATDCEATTGAAVALDGAVELTSLSGKLIFRSDLATPGSKPADAAIELVVLPTSPSFAFPQEAVQAGVGGNPQVSAQLRRDNGEAIGPQKRFGRCSAIAN